MKLRGAPKNTFNGKGPRNGGRVFSLPMEEIRDGSIEAGLLCLRAWLADKPPGYTLTQEEIAFVCGCHRNVIFFLDHNALKHLRKFKVKLHLEEF